jgi:hypothetical protein
VKKSLLNWSKLGFIFKGDGNKDEVDKKDGEDSKEFLPTAIN